MPDSLRYYSKKSNHELEVITNGATRCNISLAPHSSYINIYYSRAPLQTELLQLNTLFQKTIKETFKVQIVILFTK